MLSALSSVDIPAHQYPDTETQVLGGDTRIRHATINSSECITGRHLLENTVAAVAKAVGWKRPVGRCENLAQLVVEIGRMLERGREGIDEYSGTDVRRDKFILVFDGIDKQRDSPVTLLPALARLGETVSQVGMSARYND